MSALSFVTASLLSLYAPAKAAEALAQPDKVERKVLKNGMTLLVKEVHSAPVAAINVWVRAGSVWESPKEQGITHFIEHMLFKGTPSLKVGDIDRKIKAAGGYNNAHTRYETTDFIDVLPSDQLGVGLATMAEALRHSSFDPSELDRERQVVLEELHRGQDNPGWEAWNRFTQLAFTRHPYRFPIIGFKETVEGQDHAMLVDYWQRYYRPQNLVLVVVGDVQADSVMAQAEQAFGGWQDKAARHPAVPEEPRQKALRSDEAEGDMETTILFMGVHAPAELDADTPALDMALSILGQGISSRLNQQVRERLKLAHSVSSGLFSGKFPGLAYLYAELEPGQAKPAAAALWAEAARLARDGASEQELERQRTRLEFNEARERMSMEGMAGKLGYYEALGGDWRLGDQVQERMRKVTSADVQRVMARYFQPQGVSLVLYRPKKSQASGLDAQAWQRLLEGAAESLPPAQPLALAAPAPSASPSPAALADAAPDTVEGGFSSYTLSNGARLLVKPSHHTPLVSAFAVFKAGVRCEPAAKNGAFELLSALSIKGTQSYDAQALADRLDDLGAVISPFADHDTYGFAAQALSSKLPQALGLLAEMAAHPSLPEDEFQKEKERLLKDIKDRKDEPDEYIDELFDAAFFKGLPYGRPVEGSLATVRGLTIADLRELEARFIEPSNLVLVLVGDVEPGQALALAEASLGSKAWPGRKVSLPKLPQVKAPLKRRVVVEQLPKKQAHIMVGWKAPRVSDADYFPWRLASSVLGEGMNSRLFTEVREKRGLCYTTYSTFDRGLDAGAIRIYVGTRPASEAEALKVALGVVAQFREQGVSDEELSSAKAYACGVFSIARQDFSAEARIAAQYEVWGLGAGMIAQFPERIQAVTKEQILAAARRHLDLEHPLIAVIRP